MGKHAYLIMAHSNFAQLQKLISVLDDKRNDIYVHVDKKSVGFREKEYKTEHSSLVFVPRITVSRGGRSCMDCELRLLKAAAYKRSYDYYHLISGQDLPLKSQDEIHSFFKKNKGKSFLDFDEEENESLAFLDKIQYWYPFQEMIGNNHDDVARYLEQIQNAFLMLQKKLKYSRIKERECKYYKGRNWFSITDGLARYVLAKEEDLIEEYRFTLGAEEIFLHTLAMNSHFCEKVEHNSMRLMIQEQNDVHVFCKKDFKMLTGSDALFARKFQDTVDADIINKIVKRIKL